MELFEKVGFVAHDNYQDSNGGPFKFCKNIGGFVEAQQMVTYWVKQLSMIW